MFLLWEWYVLYEISRVLTLVLCIFASVVLNWGPALHFST